MVGWLRKQQNDFNFTKIYSTNYAIGRAMAQAVSRQPLTTEAWVRTQVGSCGICDGQSGTGHVSLRVFRFSPVTIIPPWLSMLIYNVRDEQKARWPQFRDIASSHQHEQCEHVKVLRWTVYKNYKKQHSLGKGSEVEILALLWTELSC
jgi:hypothetical protein